MCSGVSGPPRGQLHRGSSASPCLWNLYLNAPWPVTICVMKCVTTNHRVLSLELIFGKKAYVCLPFLDRSHLLFQRPASGTCTYRGSGISPTVGFLGAEKVLQRLRGVHWQDDVTETGRRATSQTIVDIVRNRTLK